ncbi:MAG: hypothetical protein RIB98_03655 [Acidimicrobiales bacterium]
MRPLPGRSVVAEYGSRFDADVGHARLADAGLESVVIGDPAHSVAPHLVTEPTFHLVVLDEIADHARRVLTDDLPPDAEADSLDAAFFQRRFVDRPPWIRRTTWAVGIAVIGPVAITATILLIWILRALFP